MKCTVYRCIRRAGAKGLCGDHLLEQHVSHITLPLVDVDEPDDLDTAALARMGARNAIAAVIRRLGQAMTLREVQDALTEAFSEGRIREALHELVDRGDLVTTDDQGYTRNGRAADRFDLARVAGGFR